MSFDTEPDSEFQFQSPSLWWQDLYGGDFFLFFGKENDAKWSFEIYDFMASSSIHHHLFTSMCRCINRAIKNLTFIISKWTTKFYTYIYMYIKQRPHTHNQLHNLLLFASKIRGKGLKLLHYLSTVFPFPHPLPLPLVSFSYIFLGSIIFNHVLQHFYTLNT